MRAKSATKRRQRGRPTKWVSASFAETVWIGKKPGMTFEVWEKWKKKRRKLGTLLITVGGLRWWPHKAPAPRHRTWEELDSWFNS